MKTSITEIIGTAEAEISDPHNDALACLLINEPELLGELSAAVIRLSSARLLHDGLGDAGLVALDNFYDVMNKTTKAHVALRIQEAMDADAESQFNDQQTQEEAKNHDYGKRRSSG